MKLFWNTVTNVLSLEPGASTSIRRLGRKRFDTLVLEVIFTDEDGEPKALGPLAAGVFVAKERTKYTDPAKLLDVEWEPPVDQGEGYVFRVLLANTALDDLLGQAEKVTLSAELVYSDGSEGGVSPTIELEVFNNYWRENEPALDPVDPPYPLPGELLTKDGNLEGLADPAAALANLGGLPRTAKFRIGATGDPEWFVTELDAWVRVVYAGDPPEQTITVLED